MFLVVLLLLLSGFQVCPFSIEKNPRGPKEAGGGEQLSLSSRRDWIRASVGAVGAYCYGRLVYNALSVRDIVYPEAHESRVASTIDMALLASLPKESSSDRQEVLRVLEVGIGKDLRLLRRGLYKNAFHHLTEKGVRRIELTGVDLLPPEERYVAQVERRLEEESQTTGLQVAFSSQHASITETLDFPDGYFDAVISCLTLCSVSDQKLALAELKRLVRPKGGTFGFVEHVAVDQNEPYRFLELQQQLFDPLQQRLADNCHLHRYTEKAIQSSFNVGSGPSFDAVQLVEERFLVDNMWPVSCQCCGVVQRV